jgi:hypothetical protein
MTVASEDIIERRCLLTFWVRGARSAASFSTRWLARVQFLFKAQTSPLKCSRRPLGSWETIVQGASLVAQHSQYVVGPWRQIRFGPGNGTKLAMDKHAPQLSSARQSRCVVVRLTRLATRQDMAVSFEFHYLVWDQVELGRHHLELPLTSYSHFHSFSSNCVGVG